MFNVCVVTFIVHRYKKFFNDTGDQSDIQSLIKTNDHLRSCLRQLNNDISKKVEKDKTNIFQKFRSSTSLPKKPKEQLIQEQLILLERDYKNNNAIFTQQEKELKQLDEKIESLSANQHLDLIVQIEELQNKIKQEQMETKQSKIFNFREGKYLEAMQGENAPKTGETQSQLDVLKLQTTNEKLKDFILKKEDLMMQYMKKITSYDVDHQKALKRERAFKPIDEVLQQKINEEKKKSDAQEENIDLIIKNQERETLKATNAIEELKILTSNTENQINAVELQIRQLNQDLNQLNSLANEVNPSLLSKFQQKEDTIFDNQKLQKDVQVALESQKNKQRKDKLEEQARAQQKEQLDFQTRILQQRAKIDLQQSNVIQKSNMSSNPSNQQYNESKPLLTSKRNGMKSSSENFVDGFGGYQKSKDILSPVLKSNNEGMIEQRKNSSFLDDSMIFQDEDINKQKDNKNKQPDSKNKNNGKQQNDTNNLLNLVEDKREVPPKKQNQKISSDAQTGAEGLPERVIIPNKNRGSIQTQQNNTNNNKNSANDGIFLTKLPLQN